MDLRDLMQSIMDETPPRFMILFGDEQKIADIYIDKIAELGYKKRSIDTVSQAITKCSTKSLTNSKNLFLINEDKDFVKAESSWNTVKDIANTSDNILIVRYAKVAKNTKFYKQNTDSAIEFPKLDTSILCNYIKKELTDFTDDNCEMLCGLCSNDYGRILLEIDKVIHYRDAGSSQDSNIAFTELLQYNAISSDIGDITFELTDAVIVGDVEKSFLLLEQAKRCGEPALRICSILYNNFRNMLAILCLGSNKSNASARTGIDNKMLYVQMKKCGAYNVHECIRNVNICQRVESGIKTGQIDSDIALDYLITALLYLAKLVFAIYVL